MSSSSSERTARPTVSVVVLTYNRFNDLRRCLDSLLKQSFQDFELIVVDNGSTDDTQELLAQYDAIVINDSTKCLPYIANLGWKAASSEIVAYISDDAEADEHWLENIVRDFVHHNGVYGVTGPQIAMKQPEMLAFFSNATKSRFLGLMARVYNIIALEGKIFEIGLIFESGAYTLGSILPSSRNIKRPIPVDLLTMTSVGLRKSLLRRLGGFEENYFFHYDGDFWLKAKRNGYKLLFDPEIVVWHYINPSGGVRSAYYTGRDYAIFYLKNFRPKAAENGLRLAVNVGYFLAYWLFKALYSNRPAYLAGIKGFARGFLEYFKLRGTLLVNSRAIPSGAK